ncbi:hypothetical protein CLF_106636 [Clonorchis sinensis]|uniref:Uncharacterized protein n=1 Tax=Clonorchis sinensis TaxID=79923 RepID=G7YQ38_CLOSI|nr:hypothetical protein CLF_106636 [Clonorchis sinensis]
MRTITWYHKSLSLFTLVEAAVLSSFEKRRLGECRPERSIVNGCALSSIVEIYSNQLWVSSGHYDRGGPLRKAAALVIDKRKLRCINIVALGKNGLANYKRILYTGLELNVGTASPKDTSRRISTELHRKRKKRVFAQNKSHCGDLSISIQKHKNHSTKKRTSRPGRTSLKSRMSRVHQLVLYQSSQQLLTQSRVTFFYNDVYCTLSSVLKVKRHVRWQKITNVSTSFPVKFDHALERRPHLINAMVPIHLVTKLFKDTERNFVRPTEHGQIRVCATVLVGGTEHPTSGSIMLLIAWLEQVGDIIVHLTVDSPSWPFFYRIIPSASMLTAVQNVAATSSNNHIRR